MKLTKSKLQKIIKEKIEESFRSPEEPEWDQFDVLERLWGSRETMTKEDLEGVLRDAGLSIVPSDYIGGTPSDEEEAPSDEEYPRTLDGRTGRPVDDLETQAHEHEQGHWMEQKMKLKKSTLQQMIEEEVDKIIGEDDSASSFPPPADSYMKAMTRSRNNLDSMAKLWDAIVDPKLDASVEAQKLGLGDKPGLVGHHVKNLVAGETYPAGEVLKARAEEIIAKGAPPLPTGDPNYPFLR